MEQEETHTYLWTTVATFINTQQTNSQIGAQLDLEIDVSIQDPK